MKDYVVEFLDKFNFSVDAKQSVLENFDKIMLQRGEEFFQIIEPYLKYRNADIVKIYEGVEQLASNINVSAYCAWLVLYIVLSKRLKDYYIECGYSEELFFTTINDIKWKADECNVIHGVWGIFVPYWYVGIFKLERFGFNKLQFEMVTCKRNVSVSGIELLGKPVINVHIPRTGGKLEKDGVDDAYLKASDFFREHLNGNPVVFVCHSWLFYPKNKEVLKPESNLYKFISDYVIAESKEYADYSEVWRLFDVTFNGDANALPADTSLRRAYIEWIKKSIPTGEGYGVYVYKK